MQQRRQFSYQSTNQLFAQAWCPSPDVPVRLIVGSCNLCRRNELELIEFNKQQVCLQRTGQAQITFPVSHLQFAPPRSSTSSSLFASTSDMLRIYEIEEQQQSSKPSQLKENNEIVLKCQLKSAQRKLSPMTYFDWSELDATRIAVSLYDSTYSLFDLVREEEIQSEQLHERSINSLEISPLDSNIMITASSDGAVRVLDSRNNTEEEICEFTTPVLRARFNKNCPQQIAVLEAESQEFSVFDMRQPLQPLVLQKHKSAVNDICWNPLNQNQILSVGNDKNAFIWDSQKAIMCYICQNEANSCSWSVANNDWCSVCSGGLLELLHI